MMKHRIRLHVSKKLGNGIVEHFYVAVLKEQKDAVKKGCKSIGFTVKE